MSNQLNTALPASLINPQAEFIFTIRICFTNIIGTAIEFYV